MRLCAVIPARGGSKRLPGKNIRPFAGEPLIAYSIAAARAAEAQTFVSTDDPDIAAVARDRGATVISRPAELAADHSTTASAVAHALHEAERLTSSRFDGVLTLQPTNPLRTRALLQRVIAALERGDRDTILTASLSTKKPAEIADDGAYRPLYDLGTRSQDQPARYYEDGVAYATRAVLLRDTGELFGASIGAIVTPSPLGRVDIDTEVDWVAGEAIYELVRTRLKLIDATPPPDPRSQDRKPTQ